MYWLRPHQLPNTEVNLESINFRIKDCKYKLCKMREEELIQQYKSVVINFFIYGKETLYAAQQGTKQLNNKASPAN